VTISVQKLNSAPGATQVATGSGTQFQATSSAPVSFTWSIVVNGSPVTGNAYGSLNTTTGALVTYTAPATVPAQPVLALRASNAANAAEYGEINLTIIAQGTAGISGNVTIPAGLLSAASLDAPAVNALGPMASLNLKQSRPFKPDWTLPHVTGQVLIVESPGAGLSKLSSAQSLRGMRLETIAQGVSRVIVPAGQRDQDFAERVALETGAFVQPNYIYRPLGTVSPNDPLLGEKQFHMTQVDAAGGWANQTDVPDNLIAVIDTGADFTHPDLAGRLTKGKDFCPAYDGNNLCTGEDDDPTDAPGTVTSNGGGHGTHTVGIVAATTNNAVGVAGLTQAGKVLVVKVFAGGSSDSATLAKAVRYAADQGSKVINMSLGLPTANPNVNPDKLFADAIGYADGKDVLMIAAAGNYQPAVPDAQKNLFYPASDARVVAVGALDPTNAISPLSARGAGLDLMAPGAPVAKNDLSGFLPLGETGIWSTRNGGGFEARYGTSEAAPQVAAVAGLIRAKNPSLTALQTRGILESTAKDLGASGRDDTFGFGLLQAGAALRKAANGNNPNPPPAQTTVYVYADFQVSPGVFDGNDARSGRTEVVMPGTTGSVSYTITVARNGSALQNGTYRIVACVNKNSNAIACDVGDLGPVSTPTTTYSGAAITGQNVTLKQF
jgi:subtilisin family serine protease